jgi:hypothetical protein
MWYIMREIMKIFSEFNKIVNTENNLQLAILNYKYSKYRCMVAGRRPDDIFANSYVWNHA